MCLIIKTLILCILSSVTCQEIKNQASSNEGIIVGPLTPVLTITYPRPDYLKIKREENVFPVSPAYNYYHDPSKRDGIFFVDILVIIDYFLHQSWMQQDFIKIFLDKWHKVDGYFQQINSPKIKLNITAVVALEKPDQWGSIGTKSIGHLDDDVYDRYEYYFIPSALDNMRNWFSNNKDSFDGLSYDLFIYMSDLMLIFNTEDDVYHLSFSHSYDVCPKNDTHESVANGGIVYAHDFFSYSAAEIISEALDIPYDDISKCGSDHIMDPELRDNIIETWSECSKEAFKKMNNNPKFDCLKHITFRDNKPDYDDY